MLKTKEDYKIPYLDRYIPKDTEVHIIGATNDLFLKVVINKLPKTIKKGSVESNDVWCISESLLTTN